jgi:histidyl-tRNA synthetase
VIGSHSLLYEVELVQIIDAIFSSLGIKVVILLNNRKILAGIAEVAGELNRITDITIAIDKLDKIGLEKVNEELVQKGIPQGSVDKLQPLIQMKGSIKEKISLLSGFFEKSEIGKKGVEEFMIIKEHLKQFNLNNKFDFDLRLARGLNYYTGTIIEVKALEVPIGSVCGGGRYDDLTGIFGLPGVSGVGISFGADRIYDVLNELNRFPENLESTTKVLFSNFGPEEEKVSLNYLSLLRKAGIPSEIYPENAKLKKQLDYANKKNIPFVVLIGEEEIKSGNLAVKNMHSGEQTLMNIEDLKKTILNSEVAK